MAAPVSLNDSSKEPIRLPLADVPDVPDPASLSVPFPISGEDRDSERLGRRAASRSKAAAFLAAVVLSSLWASGVGAYMMGYFGARGLGALDAQQWAIFTIVTIVPPLLFMAVAWLIIRGQVMGEATEALVEATEQLFAADETASRTAMRIGRAVRHELDALNSGLDTAFGRMRSLQDMLNGQTKAMEEAGSRLGAQGSVLADKLALEREKVDSAMGALRSASVQGGEMLAGRVNELKATIDAAQQTLKGAGEALEGQAARFSTAAGTAAQAPHAVALELDKQVKRIESVADAAMARAEFVLGRQERHRVAMNEMLQRLKDEGLAFETALSAEREAMEKTLITLNEEARKFDGVSAESARRLDSIMANAAARTGQLAQTFVSEASGLKEIGDAVNKTLASMVHELRKAGVGAQTAIGDATTQAKNSTNVLVSGAVAECGRLLKTADQMAAQTTLMRQSLAEAVNEMERYTSRLPTLAEGGAKKVREAVQQETDEMLNLSARTMATLHARNTPKPAPAPAKPLSRDEEETSLGFFKRHLGGAKKKGEPEKNWQMSTLLAAADSAPMPVSTRNEKRESAAASGGRTTPAAALRMLQETLSDLVVDLDAIASDAGPDLAEWRKYLAGDRGVFARKLARVIDGETVHRIAKLYRDNTVFRDNADTYLNEFDSLLGQIRAESDPATASLLANTMLTADTGKIYLAISYALGRL